VNWIARLRLPLFALVAVAQLWVPAAMILARERVLARGELFRFRTAPVDPYDAFRGRYVALAIHVGEASLPPGLDLHPGEWVYVALVRDDDDFAHFGPISREPPDGPYLRLRVRWAHNQRVRFDLPFDRYYLDEDLAPAAERAYREHSRRQGEKHDAWVAVRVLEGQAALEELYVGGMPILDFVRAQQMTPEGP